MSLSFPLPTPALAVGVGFDATSLIGNIQNPVPRGEYNDSVPIYSTETSYSLYSTLVTSEYVYTVSTDMSESGFSLYSTLITFESTSTVPIYITETIYSQASTPTSSDTTASTPNLIAKRGTSQSIAPEPTTPKSELAHPTPSTRPRFTPSSTLSTLRKHTPTTTPSSTSSETYYSVATQFTVGAPPSLCTSSNYVYETKLSAPTGWVLIVPGGTGWGPEGSIWNISTGAGAKLTNMTAKCQGSSCTNIYGNDPLQNGEMKERADGTWYLNVTAGMQESVMVVGLLVEDTVSSVASPSASPSAIQSASVASRRIRRRKAGPQYSLDVIGVPPCGLEIAKNCTKSLDFDTVQQWEAYKVDDYLKSYIKTHDIKSHADLLSTTQKEFVSDMDRANKVCDITEGWGYNCAAPGTAECLLNADYNSLRGYLMATAVSKFGLFLSRIYAAVREAGTRIGDDIDNIVPDYFKSAASQTWNKIMTIVSSAIGILVGFFIAIDFLLAPESTVWLIAVAAGLSAVFGEAGNVGGLLEDPASTDAQFDKAAEYKAEAKNIVTQIELGITDYFTYDQSQDALYNVYSGGRWIDENVNSILDDQGFFSKATAWYEKMLIAHFIAEAFEDNSAYILFVPYDDNKKYHLKTTKFDQETCKHHWVNDPSWKYDAYCDMIFGPNGQPGMALFTRPDSLGSESKSWADQPLSYNGTKITTWDIMASSIWGQQQYGFNYTYYGQNWTDLLVNKGVEYTKSLVSDVTWTTEGLFNIPVCVLDDLVYVPGVSQVMMDIADNHNKAGYSSAKAPCSCGSYTYTSPDGKSGKFTDFVGDKVKDSIGTSCKIWAADASPTADWVSGEESSS